MGIVTYSPSTMIRLQEDFVKLPDFSQVVPFACGLHAFNLIAKDLINYKPLDKTVKTSKRLVNYFNRAIYWKEVLHKWAKDNNIPHKLQTFSPTRWYSFSCVLQGVDTYWYGFQHCLSLCQNPTLDTPELSDSSKPPTPTLQSVIRDADHHCSNKYMLLLIKPIVDAIGRLERKDSHLGQIWENLIIIYREVKKADLPYRLEEFRIFTLAAIQTRAQKFFDEDIYYIALFLCPR